MAPTLKGQGSAFIENDVWFKFIESQIPFLKDQIYTISGVRLIDKGLSFNFCFGEDPKQNWTANLPKVLIPKKSVK